ncbi:FTR1 family protein [Mycetohabitans sp. B5]|uniref:High-affinity iron transporter n=1 Tax=Mycetohabitans endofungorum TaxID=417203 RepID=A0A2P5K7R3_9BURK|nr:MULTISPECIES: FTR1 family protein [Mycetohabitans]MCG1054332.1 FTR1 family protein [Mycetohabitans sp. B5]PPB82748.1 high-affinity iron transporter [Mycetohabitans endofungorum]
MGQILFIVWRESVEALLVVGILHAWLTNGDAAARKGLPWLWLGVGAGLLAAVGLGAALIGFTEVLSGDAQDYFQTAMVLVACVLIVQMVLWMKRHGRTLKRDMEMSLAESRRNANWWGIAVLAALAIAREGSETVIFLYGLGFGRSGHVDVMQWLAVLIGLALALLTFYLLQLGGRIFSWRAFFRVTEVMLLFLGAGLFEAGIDKLIDKEIVPTGIDMVWDTSHILDDSGTVGSLVATLTGYRAHPALANVIAYALFWLVVWVLLRWTRQRQSSCAQRKPA